MFIFLEKPIHHINKMSCSINILCDKQMQSCQLFSSKNDFVFESAAFFRYCNSSTRCLCWSNQYTISVGTHPTPQILSAILQEYIYEFNQRLTGNNLCNRRYLVFALILDLRVLYSLSKWFVYICWLCLVN